MRISIAARLSLFASLITIGTVFAQPCDAILVGIHQREFFNSQSNRLKTSLEILKRYESSSYAQAQSNATNAGFTLPIADLPVQFAFGHKADSSGNGNWAMQLESYFARNEAEANTYTSNFETANKDVVEAWTKCMVERKGVIAWAEQERGGDEFVILVRYKPYEMKKASIKDIEFGSQFEPLSSLASYKGRELSFAGEPAVIVVKRKAGANKQGQIIVHTTINQDAYVNLRPFPVPVKVDLPPRPAIDFDGDYLADTFEFKGHPEIGWVEIVKNNLWKSGKGRPHSHRLFRFPTGSAAAALIGKIVG